MKKKSELVRDDRAWTQKSDHWLINTYADPDLDMIVCPTCGDILADRRKHGRMFVDGLSDLYKDEDDRLFIVCSWCGEEVVIPRNPKRRRAIDWTTWRHPDIDGLPPPKPSQPTPYPTPLNQNPYIWRKGSKRANEGT